MIQTVSGCANTAHFGSLISADSFPGGGGNACSPPSSPFTDSFYAIIFLVFAFKVELCFTECLPHNAHICIITHANKS